MDYFGQQYTSDIVMMEIIPFLAALAPAKRKGRGK